MKIVLLAAGWALLGSAVFGQGVVPLDPVLQHAIASHQVTTGESQKYTYIERHKTLNFNSKGKQTSEWSDTYEIIFLEGAPYSRKILHDEKPLSDKDQKAEEKKMHDVATARREQGKSHGLLHANFQFSLPFDQLASRFEVTAGGAEEIEGRKNLVFSAVPKERGDEALKRAAHDGLAYEVKFWIDEKDGVFTRIEGKVLADGMRFGKDSLIRYEFKQVNHEVWLPALFSFKGKVRFLAHDIYTESEQSYSDYKKFSAESKVLVGEEGEKE